MELRDTVDMMLSDNYKERFCAEYYQTKLRYKKLKSFNDKIEIAHLGKGKEPKHDCPYSLLRIQQKIMEEYLHILEIRAEIEDILI